MTLQIAFEDRVNGHRGLHRDMMGHLPTLALLAAQCNHCTEFGIRTGNSTTALLYGLAQRIGGGKLVSYDIESPNIDVDLRALLPAKVAWEVKQADTRFVRNLVDVTDLLFIDTMHTYAQVKEELRCAGVVRRYLVFHDTARDVNWLRGEHNQEGIGRAIEEFMDATPTWRPLIHFTHCNGLLVLERTQSISSSLP